MFTSLHLNFSFFNSLMMYTEQRICLGHCNSIRWLKINQTNIFPLCDCIHWHTHTHTHTHSLMHFVVLVVTSIDSPPDGHYYPLKRTAHIGHGESHHTNYRVTNWCLLGSSVCLFWILHLNQMRHSVLMFVAVMSLQMCSCQNTIHLGADIRMLNIPKR